METTVSSSPGDPGPSLVGKLLDGRYRLDSVIARGGMATVYLAIDTRLDRIVAVKVMHKGLADDPLFVERFTREAKSAAKVAGPEVVAVHDTGTDPDTGIAYLVMEHIRGQNLRQLLLTIGPLSPSRAVAVMEPVLRALASAHAVGMVHRDVKPENVLLGDDGRVKVADFGLARAAESTTITQTTSHLMGSVAYLAPEQVERGTADARSDVYAAGVLLWELLTGTPPHSGDTAIAVAHAHVYTGVPPPSTVAEGIPANLDALVVRATRRDPSARPVDAGEFLRDLLTVKATLPAAPPVTAMQDTRPLVVPRVVDRTPTKPTTPRKSRRGLIGIAVLVVLAVLALAGGYYLGSFRYTHAPRVIGLDVSQATAQIRSQQLKVETLNAVSSGPDDVVLRQEPLPGARIRKHGTVRLFVGTARAGKASNGRHIAKGSLPPLLLFSGGLVLLTVLGAVGFLLTARVHRGQADRVPLRKSSRRTASADDSTHKPTGDPWLQEILRKVSGLWAPPVAEIWLRSSNAHLNGARPCDLIELGRAEEVLEALNAELSGAFA
jgi:serine/threonine protein kinase